MTLLWPKIMWRLQSTLCMKPMMHLPPMCSLTPLQMPLLLYRHQGHTLLSKHYIKASWSLSDGLFWFLRLLPDLSLIIMWSTGLRFRSQSQGCHGSQVLHLHQDHLMSMASLHTTLSLIVPRTHIPSQEYHLIGSGVISNAATTPMFYTTKGAYFLICVWIPKPLQACSA